MRKIILVMVVLLSFFSDAGSQQIYKCTDANGVMTFSDKPCGNNAEIINPNFGEKQKTYTQDNSAAKIIENNSPKTYEKYNCESGYPHVPKKNGIYDSRENDLWELAQDWVFYRNQILLCNNQGDQKCAEKARRNFQRVTNWLNAYSEEHIDRVLNLAQECKLKN